ncbi:MAG: hypothetical protein FWF73_00205 [Spirochaetes bacterium]|nr:hypothetical protein [Spirochaetota bacterium]
MKSKVKFSTNSIKIHTPITVPFIVSVFGALLCSIGAYKLGYIYPFDHILIGLGIIFFAMGLFSFLNTKYYKILINEDPGYYSLVESTGWDISPFKIPYKYFTEIIVQRIINKNKPEFGVLLKNRKGALLLISRFSDEEKTLSFTNELEKTIGLPVTINHEVPYNMIDKTHTHDPYNINLPDNSRIRVIERKEFQELIWNIRYHPLQVVFMFCIYYGFYHIIDIIVLPMYKFNNIITIGVYVILGVILSILLTVVISNLFETHNVIINKDSIVFFNKIFWKKSGEIKIKKADIAFIRSSIEFSNEDMVIGTLNGVNGLNSYINKFSENKKHVKKVMNKKAKQIFRKEFIKLNGTHLKLGEKLFIDQFILKYL